MTQALSPRIIQTILPFEQKPELSIVATWTKRAVTEEELLELEPGLSENLVIKLPRWKEDVVAQPTRLLAALMTGDLYLLEAEWSKVELALRSAQIPIEYLNRVAYEAGIVIEESISLRSLAELLLGTAAAYVASKTGMGHALGHAVHLDPALGDAVLHLTFGAGFLTLTPGMGYIADRFPRFARFCQRRPLPTVTVAPAPVLPAGDLYKRLQRPERAGTSPPNPPQGS
jgi:hypothetical protein